MKKKQEIKISNKVIHILINKGFKINRYYARTTRSIYLKLDYGVCGAIRISDHIGKKKYKYKFNLIRNYNGPREIDDDGYHRKYYSYHHTNELIADVEKEKKVKIQKYGLKNYEEYMKENSKRDLYKSFKKVA